MLLSRQAQLGGFLQYKDRGYKMELIRLNHDNLAQEHICCAISNDKDIQVMSKKAWLKARLDEGLVFLKGDVRGKCFIEYIPAEYAWLPVDAPDYMFIDCLWVSGQFKGQGYSNLLLEKCIRDSREKGKAGLAVLSSPKKLGFLSDPKYMKYQGFVKADAAPPYFELLYLPFAEGAVIPGFKTCVKQPQSMNKGFSLYYSNQCPFTAKYVPILAAIAEAHGAALTLRHIDTRAKAQSAPCPFTAFSLYYDGEFITHEIQSEKKFEKLLSDRGF